MSEIFKICHINASGIKKEFIFNGSLDESETFSKQETEIVYVNSFIHRDDSIRRVKEKIFMHCDLDISISEMYLFGLIEKVLTPEIIYNRLTQDDKYDLTYYRLKTFLRNIVKEQQDFLTPIEDSVFIKREKPSYTYEEFINMKYIDWNQLIKHIVPIGQKIVINKSYNFIVNPFFAEEDTFLMREIANFTSLQNKKLLFESGNIENNTLYLCTASDVLRHENSVDDIYILKMYYPELYITHKINSSELLEQKRDSLIEKNRQFIIKNKISEHNESIDLLYKIFYMKKAELNYVISGISNISFTIHPTSKINLPLEILFKLIHSSESIKMVKYNPGTRQENIYRLFTGKNIASNGKKIPQLYAENNYKKGKIIKLMSNIEKKKRVTFITTKTLDNREINIYSNFLENGNVEVNIDFGSKYQTLETVEGIVRDTLNIDILEKINNFLEQSGYKYVTFNRLDDENVEINNIDYIINIKNNKKINLTRISKCISSVFKMDTSKIKKSSDLLVLDYKRVSNYSEMDSIERYITTQRQKYNMRLESIIEGLMVNFKLSKNSAEEKIATWSENIQHEISQFENKRVKVLTNPGINIIMRNQKKLQEGVFIPITSVEITNVTNVSYLRYLHIFIDSLLRLVIDKKSTNIPVKEINRFCKVGQLKEIVEDVEVVAIHEKTVFNSISDGDPIAIVNNKLDEIIGAEEEEDWSDSEDEDMLSLSMEEDDEEKSRPSIVSQKSTTPGAFTEQKEEKKVEQFDDDDDEQVMEEDLSKYSISGNNNIFLKRLRENDKDLFLIEKKKGFKSYSKACPWQYRKYPVVLTEKDKKYIDSMDNKLNVKSYDEHITYGSKPDKKLHYICPRFWCFRDENGKQRSLSFEQVNKGECGGWNALIPENAKKITRGKRIYEFTDKRMHMDGLDTDNKLVYRPMYPGFQARNKHHQGLCVPCCFKTPTTTIDDNGVIWDYVKHGKNKWAYKSRETGEVETKAPVSKKYKFMFDPKEELPTYEEKDGNVLIDTIKGDGNLIRPLSKRKQAITYNDCNQKSSIETKNEEEEVDEEEVDSSFEISNDTPLLETFPLPKNKLGYLTIGLQKFLGFNCRSICQKTISDTRLKEDVWCLMRIGIEKSKFQSFIGLMAFTYNQIHSKNINIKKMKQIIIKSISLDIFITLQNGNLVSVFEPSNIDDVNMEGVNIDSIQHLLTSELNAKKIVGAYLNFLNYIASTSEFIDHTYLWDYFTRPGLFLDTGLNLVLLNAPDDDITNKIQLVCPTHVYSNEFFSIEKPTILIYSNNDYYEPVIRYKKERHLVNFLFDIRNLTTDAPEIVRIMRIIKENMMINCARLNSLPVEYNQKHDFVNNILSYEISKKIKEISNLEIVNQIVNNKMKVIGLLIKDSDKNIDYYVPCYPSSINILKPTISMHTTNLMIPYDDTVEGLKNIYTKSKKGIPCRPKYKVVNDNVIVGILTITNQFIPTIPESYTAPPLGVNEESDGLLVFNGNTKYYENFNTNESGETKISDNKRNKLVKQIKMESNFYNIFRNTLRIVLNSSVEKDRRVDLLNMVKNRTLNYTRRLEEITQKLKDIMEDYVDFSEFDIDSIDEIAKCFGLSKKSCKEKSCCSFSNVTGNCELLLPKYNMINDNDNSEYYYVRVADEMLRYSKIRSFFFEKEAFLQFDKVRYNLNDNEIILLEDLLINKYFQDIKPIIKSEYIKSSRTYELSQPDKKIDFSNKYSLRKNEKLSTITNCLLGSKEDPSFNLRVGQQWRELQLGSWNKGEGEHMSFSRIRRTNDCIWKYLTILIEEHSGTEITKQELKNVLLTKYEQLDETGYMEQIKKVFKTERKENIVRELNKSTSLETLFTFDNYIFSLIDLFIVANIYELPLIVISSRATKTFGCKSMIFGPVDSVEYYIFKISNFVKTNAKPEYGILKYKNNVKIPISKLKTARETLFENGNIENIDSYFERYQIQSKKANKKVKKRKIILKKRKPKKTEGKN